MRTRFHMVVFNILLCCFALCSVLCLAQDIELAPPPPGEFVLDLAELLSPEEEQALNELGAAVLSEKAVPIIVVTIDRMADYGGAGMRIETFATLLYNQWEIGHEQFGKDYWNKGALLLVAYGDRFARIELGDGFERQHDDMAREIMDEQIIARFKSGNFSGGVVGGAEALAAMAREEELPRGPIPWRSYALVAAFIGLAIFTVVSLIRRRASGWAWIFWGVAFGILGMVLLNMMRRGGGGFSGGSFGGGFSTGGGASGSW